VETTIARTQFPAEMGVGLAAEYLGLNFMYTYALISTEVLPSRMKDRRRVVKRTDLDRFLEERASKTA
jgi:excisionase family DNA binding protein